MKIILISYPESIENEGKLINELFDDGLQYFHLRKPQVDINKVEYLLNQIESKYYNKIIVHYYFNLASKYNLKGLHFNESTHIQKSKFNISHSSYSAHSTNEILKIDKFYNYIFLSPIFNSISKVDYNSGFNLDDLKEFIDSYKLTEKIIALGGVSYDNISKVKEVGFGGVALLGAVWNSNNPIEEFKKIRDKINE